MIFSFDASFPEPLATAVLRAPTVFEVSVNGKVERKFATSEVHIRTGRGPGAAKGS